MGMHNEGFTAMDIDSNKLQEENYTLREGLKLATKAVDAFHARCDLPRNTILAREVLNPDNSEMLEELSGLLSDAASTFAAVCKAGIGDIRVERTHIMMEELAEFIYGLATCNKLEMLDGLADLEYTLHGSAAVFELPLAEAFMEVHRSNMTKGPGQDRPGHPAKTASYSPPDLSQFLS
jgi:phosphoribosyl-ATP pyrophosphohydrolase